MRVLKPIARSGGKGCGKNGYFCPLTAEFPRGLVVARPGRGVTGPKTRRVAFAKARPV